MWHQPRLVSPRFFSPEWTIIGCSCGLGTCICLPLCPVCDCSGVGNYLVDVSGGYPVFFSSWYSYFLEVCILSLYCPGVPEPVGVYHFLHLWHQPRLVSPVSFFVLAHPCIFLVIFLPLWWPPFAFWMYVTPTAVGVTYTLSWFWTSPLVPHNL